MGAVIHDTLLEDCVKSTSLNGRSAGWILFSEAVVPTVSRHQRPDFIYAILLKLLPIFFLSYPVEYNLSTEVGPRLAPESEPV